MSPLTLHKLTNRPGENWFLVGSTGIILRQTAKNKWRLRSFTLQERDPQWCDRNSELFSVVFPRRGDAHAHLEALLAYDPPKAVPHEQRVRITRVGSSEYQLATSEMLGHITRDSCYPEGWTLRVAARDRSWGPRTMLFLSLAHARSWAEQMQCSKALSH